MTAPPVASRLREVLHAILAQSCGGRLFGGITMVVMPGCSNRLGPVMARQSAGGIDRPNLPDITLERAKECVAEYGFLLETGRHEFTSNVEVNEDGDKEAVTIDGLPDAAPDFGACMRNALRDMPIAEEPFRQGVETLKYRRQEALAEQRKLMGHTVVIVVAGVTIIVSEIVLEAGAITILMATTVKVIDKAKDDVAEALRRRRMWENDCDRQRTECLMSDIADQPGGLHKHTLCHMCREACIQGRGNWPSQIERFNGTMASCAYWRHKGN